MGIDDEMLSNAPDDGSEGLGELPVNTIIQHVQENNGLISDWNLTVALELNQKLLNPVKSFLVVGNLSHEKSSLDFLKIFHFLLGLSWSEFINILFVHLFVEWEFFDVDNNFWQSLGKTQNPLDKWMFSRIQDIDSILATYLN